MGVRSGGLALASILLLPEPHTWMLEYYRNQSLEGEAVHATMFGPDIGSEAVVPPGLLDRDTFSLRLRSCLRLSAAGSYQFKVAADNGARLYVENELIVDAWVDGRATVGRTIDLTRANYPITVEYFDAGGAAKLRVEMAHLGVYTSAICIALQSDRKVAARARTFESSATLVCNSLARAGRGGILCACRRGASELPAHDAAEDLSASFRWPVGVFLCSRICSVVLRCEDRCLPLYPCTFRN